MNRTIFLKREYEKRAYEMSASVIGGADGPTAIFLAGTFNAFMIPAFGVMILFYGIYFIKQLAQK